ncbi:hypothetical protein [Aliidiomarina celeris]|nr:hypothetical protein [Aliidiomarina celeris]
MQRERMLAKCWLKPVALFQFH